MASSRRQRRLLSLFFLFPAGAIFASPAEDFHALLDEHWATAEHEQIFFRSDPDAFRMNGELPSFNDEAYARREAYNKSILRRLADIDPSKLTGQDRISYKIFLYERQTERDSYAQLDRFFPINALFGYHTYFADAPANMAFLTNTNYDNYLVSLADFPRYNAEHIALLRDAAMRGYTQYCDSMQDYEKTIAKHVLAEATDSKWFGPFLRFPGAISTENRVDYTARGTALIRDRVIPEYRKLLEFYEKEYAPRCRKNAGISSIEGGAEHYAWLVRYFTTTDMTPAEIHQLGITELARIRQEMELIIDKIGFDGDFAEFLDYLRNEPQYFAKSALELLSRTALIAKTAEGELPRFFTVLPRTPYNIKSSGGRGAYYVASTGDGNTPGTYFIGTDNLQAEPLYGLTALTLHEGVPGHHLQAALALEVDLPRFRRSLYHAAYGEGWGLYAERLGLEMGMYGDPIDDFGRLTYEAWRAARLVVDTGIHIFGWTRERAIRFMLDNTALTEPEVVAQIDRYITWPAQATAYKIGEIRIRALRAKAEKALGAKFDIRRFHDTVVGNGSLPIAVLDEIVDEWIGGY
ncbi:MAG: DUF885 domain-containing protein [Woeseia sp.]|nr:DUF885 domain-containing protein [Woeseia sp.]